MNFRELRQEYWTVIDSIECSINSQLTDYLTSIYSGYQHNLEFFAELSEDGNQYEETYYIRLDSSNNISRADLNDYHIRLVMCNDMIPLADLVSDYVDELDEYISIPSQYKLLHKFLEDISRDTININTTEKLWDIYGNYDFSQFIQIDTGVWQLPFKYNDRDPVYLKQCTTSGYYGYSFNTKLDRIHLGAWYYRTHIAAIYAAMKNCGIDINTLV
jgi:hypothetical protein